jgi:hypothetical protein
MWLIAVLVAHFALAAQAQFQGSYIGCFAKSKLDVLR